jgi:hypothetical protein
MLEELQSFWQNTTPEIQAAVQTGCLVIVVLLGGHVLGSMVARCLRRRHFDTALRLPGSSSPGAVDDGITPTFVAGQLVRLTVWAGAGWWLAHQYGRADLANTITLILSRTWTVAALLLAALALGSLLARRLIDCLGATRADADGSPLRNGAAASHRNAAGAVGAAAYFLVMLLVLLIAADFFEWPLTRSVALALWQLAQNLLIAGAALLIGYIGACWARDLARSEGPVSPEQRAGQYTALGIVAATTLLAMGVLLSSSGILLGLAGMAALGFSLWLVRGLLPDLTAGVKLRTQKVREVWLDGAPWQVAKVGILTSQVIRAGAIHPVQNRLLLEARYNGAKSEPVAN